MLCKASAARKAKDDANTQAREMPQNAEVSDVCVAMSEEKKQEVA